MINRDLEHFLAASVRRLKVCFWVFAPLVMLLIGAVVYLTVTNSLSGLLRLVLMGIAVVAVLVWLAIGRCWLETRQELKNYRKRFESA